MSPHRSSRAEYSDKALGFVQLKRDGNLCHVKALVTPEHKVNAKPYQVHCLVDEGEGTILKAFCSDCAACQGGCKHAVAFVTWLHRRSNDPPVVDYDYHFMDDVLKRANNFWRENIFPKINKDTIPP
ncbi:hypothetical protein M8J77_009242 [Diaphorina citri]|nr:hypothetical protein M8J77_009242 [Diaphorina citri]